MGESEKEIRYFVKRQTSLPPRVGRLIRIVTFSNFGFYTVLESHVI